MKIPSLFQARATLLAVALSGLFALGACAGTPANATPAPSPAPQAQSAGAPAAVDRSCKIAADCAVKDVGNCCGYMPSCVNKDSPTFPEQVKAQCKAQGRVGACGMQNVTGCECTAGKCTNVHTDLDNLVQ